MANIGAGTNFTGLLENKTAVMIRRMTLARVADDRKFRPFAFLALLIFLASSKVVAQRKTNVASLQKQQMQASSKDAAAEILQEYNLVLAKYDLNSRKGKKDFSSKITALDRVKLETLYIKMSKKQQAEQIVGFMPNIPQPPPIVPTDKQLEQWENEKIYGVWIDGQKVANNTLSNYSNTDFSAASVNRLSRTAANYGKYFYQVDLMTKEYYQEYYNHVSASKNKMILFVRTPNKDAAM